MGREGTKRGRGEHLFRVEHRNHGPEVVDDHSRQVLHKAVVQSPKHLPGLAQRHACRRLALHQPQQQVQRLGGHAVEPHLVAPVTDAEARAGVVAAGGWLAGTVAGRGVAGWDCG